MLETVINIIEWPSLQYCTMSAFGGDALQRKAMSHKSSFIIIDNGKKIILNIFSVAAGSDRVRRHLHDIL